jgi:hypothetical protein
MDILINIIVVGFAVAYLIELLTSFAESPAVVRVAKVVLTLPLSFLGCWYLDIIGFPLVVAGPAAAFVSLAVMVILNRPAPTQVINRR